MTSSTKDVAIAQLATYILLLVLFVYLLFAHGKKGIFGFLYLLVFCSLQVISAGLQLSSSGNTTAATLSSVGLSPLLLGAGGVLHEAHFYLSAKPTETWLFKAIFQLFLHLLTIAGVILLAIGTSNLAKDVGTSKYHTDLTHRKVGSIILLIAFLLIFAHAVLLALKYWASKRTMAKRLFYSVIFALPLIFIRVTFTIVYSFASPNSHTFDALNPVTASIAIRVVFLLLIPFLAALCLAVGGFASRRLPKTQNSNPPRYEAETGSEMPYIAPK